MRGRIPRERMQSANSGGRGDCGRITDRDERGRSRDGCWEIWRES